MEIKLHKVKLIGIVERLEMFTSFMNKIGEIVDKNVIGQLDNMEMYVSKINFVSRNEANVEIIIKSKDLGEISEFDSLYLEAFEKAGISEDEQLENINKEKLDKFHKYFEDQIKGEMENTDYTEESQELKSPKPRFLIFSFLKDS